MSGHNEVLCDTCIHRELCIHKDAFISAHNAVNNVTVYLKDNRMINVQHIECIESVNLRCKHYRGESDCVIYGKRTVVE